MPLRRVRLAPPDEAGWKKASCLWPRGCPLRLGSPRRCSRGSSRAERPSRSMTSGKPSSGTRASSAASGSRRRWGRDRTTIFRSATWRPPAPTSCSSAPAESPRRPRHVSPPASLWVRCPATALASLDVGMGPGKDRVDTVRYDSPSLAGFSAMIQTGPGKDRWLGGPLGETWIGGPRRRLCPGTGGNDRFIGGPGNDRMFGDLGIDFFLGGPGQDFARGGKGNDRGNGGPGRRQLQGLSGASRPVCCATLLRLR